MTSFGPNADDPNKIVITNDDLDDSISTEASGIRGGTPTSAMASTPQLPPLSGLPPVPAQARPVAVQVPMRANSHLLTKIGANSVISGLAAGAVGGFIGFLLAENFQNPSNLFATTPSGLDAKVGLWAMFFAAGLGFILMGWDGFTSGSMQKAFRDGIIGVPIGAASGFIGGFVSQYAYGKLLGNPLEGGNDGKQILARVVGWAILGCLLGGGLGIKGGPKKFANGLMGGLIGGAAGGLIFQLIYNASPGSSGFFVRMFGLVATGVGVGFAVGVVERARRDSWIQITAGPMTGKEFILYNAQTRVGRDYHNDIVMAKDPLVNPFHAVFARDAAGTVWVTPNAGAAITVNGLPSAGSQLRNADVVSVGGSSFTYQERMAS